jgi:hypothetical protein
MFQNKSILLSTAYFPPIQYFSKLTLFEKVFIEQFENFTKQTYRNRCVILAANGPVSLIVPVVKGRTRKTGIKDLLISYDTEWQRNHWRTLFSAYNSSPFFEFYKDDIRPFFEVRKKFLLELNLEILEKLCELLEIRNRPILTRGFEELPAGTVNFREILSPKMQKAESDPHFQSRQYTQVFHQNFGFLPNLSILDLLFNEGPKSVQILKQSTIGETGINSPC